ncbi:TlpA disulfide reductase family protein [Novosphingobium sp. AAP1]|uniref:TlpA family protein disulfide reductase n=1 Tax=Novosphingobium sp. AAP1 TaxID=1523413 RepID=UPI001E59FAE6|nr:TlpA disulfide reductase family protein [Novosphingobium sp. AAP1]
MMPIRFAVPRRLAMAGAAALLAATAFAPTAPALAKDPVVGQPAPPFDLRLIDGTKLSLADLKGQVVVLNFWATWCGPCKAELPLLDQYYALQQKHGLRVFAVTTEDSLPNYQLKKLFAVMHIPAVRALKGPYAPLTGVPTNFVIDRAGVVRYAKAGAFDLDDLNTVLVPLLREAPPQG